ncbi:MAG TPA: hypothetical protein PLM71_05750 [Syntrophorhabdaceae bacterium]|nr:hypothetical protein [Syntrophorhabdaceae bacterium]
MYNYLCRLLLEAGTRLIYYITPLFSKYLESIKKDSNSFHHEMALDEKIVFELGFAGAIASKKTACMFSTEQLFEAMDPIMTSAYTGVKYGFLIVCIKDTPHEVSFIGPFSKLPVIFSDELQELPYVIDFSYNISKKYEIPVILQITPDEGFDKEILYRGKALSFSNNNKAQFIKDPGRWAATPSFRYKLHQVLNEKIENIREEFETYKGNKAKIKGKTGIIITKNIDLDFYDEDTSILKISTIFPLPKRLVDDFIKQMDEVFLIEGEYPAVELQIKERSKINSEVLKTPSRIQNKGEQLFSFEIIRDWFGPASSINIAHGIKKSEPERKVVAITYENHFLHSGMPSFINVLYNNSSFALLIIVNEMEEEIRRFMEGCGFKDTLTIKEIEDLKDYKDKGGLTVYFYRGMI